MLKNSPVVPGAGPRNISTFYVVDAWGAHGERAGDKAVG